MSRGRASKQSVGVYQAVSVEKGARRPPLPAAVVCPPGGRRGRRLAITADLLCHCPICVYPFESGGVPIPHGENKNLFLYVGLLQAERDRHHLVGLGEQGKSAAVGTSKLAAVHAPCPAALRARVRARQSQGMTRVNSFLGPVDDYVTTNTTLTKSQSHKE